MFDPGTSHRDIFISHVEEDAEVALRLAERLEVAGYTTWYFERDSLPGVSYLLQTGEAIDRSRAVVVIISESLIGSPNRHAENEVVRAYEQGKHLVPVLRGLTHSDFQRRESKLRQCIGSANSVVIPHNGVLGIVPRIVKGLEALGVHPSAHREPSVEDGGRIPSESPGAPRAEEVLPSAADERTGSQEGGKPLEPRRGDRAEGAEALQFSLFLPAGRIALLIFGILMLVAVTAWIRDRVHRSSASKLEEVARPVAAGDSTLANQEGAENNGALLATLRGYKVDIYFDKGSRADSMKAARVAKIMVDELRVRRVVLVQATPEFILRIGTPVAYEVRYDAPAERGPAELLVQELSASGVGASFEAREVESYSTPGVLSVVVFSRWLPAHGGMK